MKFKNKELQRVYKQFKKKTNTNINNDINIKNFMNSLSLYEYLDLYIYNYLKRFKDDSDDYLMKYMMFIDGEVADVLNEFLELYGYRRGE